VRSGNKVVVLLPVLDFGGIESRAVIQATHWPTNTGLQFCCFTEAGNAAHEQFRAMGYPVDELRTRPSVRNLSWPLATLALSPSASVQASCMR
jgi:hypothetical protein